MNDKSTQAEPTMEEILASIRRIISEDGEPGAAPSAEKVVPMATTQATQQAQPTPPVEEDVLELTEVVEEEVVETVDELDVEDEPEVIAAPEVEAMVEPEPEMEEEPDVEPEPDMEQEDLKEDVALKIEAKLSEWEDPVDPADEEEAIMSGESSDKARNAFMDLSDLLVAGYQGSDNTLEAMVRKMLKPMLKSWLDENLPEIVERVVAREVARLARARRP